WADNQVDRLPALAAELVQRRVAVIAATGGIMSAMAAKTATTTIPVVFDVGEDPVKYGLVASLARPGGNLTGINFFTTELAAKQLEILRGLVPAAIRIAVLADPASASTESILRQLETAGRAMGLQMQVFNASTGGEINAAFAAIARTRPDAVFVGISPLACQTKRRSFGDSQSRSDRIRWNCRRCHTPRHRNGAISFHRPLIRERWSRFTQPSTSFGLSVRRNDKRMIKGRRN